MRFVAQRFQRRVQQLVDETVEGLADLFFGPRIQIGKPVEQPPHLIPFRLLPSVSKLLDHRRRDAVVHLAHETAGLLLNDLPRGWQLSVTEQAVAAAGGLKIVYRVEIDLGEISYFRLEVSRHGQVEDEQRRGRGRRGLRGTPRR